MVLGDLLMIFSEVMLTQATELFWFESIHLIAINIGKFSYELTSHLFEYQKFSSMYQNL